MVTRSRYRDGRPDATGMAFASSSSWQGRTGWVQLAGPDWQGRTGWVGLAGSGWQGLLAGLAGVDVVADDR